MADLLYNNALLAEKNGDIDYVSGTFYAMIVLDTYTPNIDTHTTYDDVKAHEIANSNGYTTGGEEATVTIGALNNSEDKLVVTFSSVDWPSATFTGRRAIYFQLDGDDIDDSILVGVKDFNANLTGTGATFSIAPSSRVIQNNSTGA